MQLIDGKKIAEVIKAEIASEVAKTRAEGGKIPHLAAILVGHDGGSETYVAHKVKDCEQVGFRSTLVRYEDDVTEAELLERIVAMNQDTDIDGLIVQLPLPRHISEQKLIETIHPAKDVDGFHPVNTGRMMLGMPAYLSATPAGILELLDRYDINTAGMHCVIIGRSNIVGRPLANLLSLKAKPGNATVTVCHSHTRDIASHTVQADLLIAAMGKPGFVSAAMVKEGAVVIDVGTTRVPATDTKSGYRLKGDVKFEEVAARCSFITPVPGGVGPMTRIALLKNTLLAARKAIYR